MWLSSNLESLITTLAMSRHIELYQISFIWYLLWSRIYIWHYRCVIQSSDCVSLILLAYYTLRCSYVGYVLDNKQAPGTGPIWFDKVQCKGHETHFDQCSHGPWGSHNCSHRDDVSISCATTTTTTTTMSTTTMNTTTTTAATTIGTTTPVYIPGNLSKTIWNLTHGT